jgi:hypothetical protein
VKELHDFAIEFRKNLPAFYRTTNPDTTRDAVCHFVPTHCELLSYLIDQFLMSLHRPYIFTRDKSQRQVYESSLAIWDSQGRYFEVMRTAQTQFYISSTFSTFDAAVLLAVVLLSNPERYHKCFVKLYRSLQSAVKRLQIIGSTIALAKVGSEILQTTLRRIVEAQKSTGLTVNTQSDDLQDNPQVYPSKAQGDAQRASSSARSNSTPTDVDPWQFETDPSVMDWTAQNSDFFDFNLPTSRPPCH